MDPLSLILAAITAGATASAKDTASAAIKDSYQGLKALIQRKFEGKPTAQAALVEYEEDPETYEKPLKKALLETHMDTEHDVVETAQRVLTLIQPQQAAMGKYNIQNTGTVQGQIVGDHAHVTLHFGDTPKK
ncbi:MAG: hypothetical protein ACJ788_09100 [Ktedonobacteraceae bacterium]